jgi:anti-sigma regulatory factor (Ser/Thr protein kinase)
MRIWRRRIVCFAAFQPAGIDIAFTISGVTAMAGASAMERQTSMFPAEPQSVGEARAWLVAVASGLVSEDRLSNLALVVSEIVTNAVLHGDPAGKIKLAATPKSDYLCVQVTDGGAGFVPRPGAMASDTNGGFGLFLVERLTRRWGLTRENGATRVWFEFDHTGSP